MIYIPSKWRECHHIPNHPRETPSGVRTFEVQSCFQRRCCMGPRQCSVSALQQTPIPDQHGVPALRRIPPSLLRHRRSSFHSERAIFDSLHLEMQDWLCHSRILCHVFLSRHRHSGSEPWTVPFCLDSCLQQASGSGPWVLRSFPPKHRRNEFTGAWGMPLHWLHRCWRPYSAKVDVQIPLRLSSRPWYPRRRPKSEDLEK